MDALLRLLLGILYSFIGILILYVFVAPKLILGIFTSDKLLQVIIPLVVSIGTSIAVLTYWRNLKLREEDQREKKSQFHGVDFTEAIQVFHDPLRIEALDD